MSSTQIDTVNNSDNTATTTSSKRLNWHKDLFHLFEAQSKGTGGGKTKTIAPPNERLDLIAKAITEQTFTCGTKGSLLKGRKENVKQDKETTSLKEFRSEIWAKAHQVACQRVLDSFHDTLLSETLEVLEQNFESLERLKYRDYRQIREILSENNRNNELVRQAPFIRQFNAKRFMLYPRPDKSVLDGSLIEQYLVSQVSIARIYAELASFDIGGKGYLTRSELTTYFTSTLSGIESLSSYEQDLKTLVYVPFVIAKFFYQLDPSSKGRISTVELMKSRYLTLYGQLRDGGLTHAELNLNPFYGEKALDLWDYFEEISNQRKAKGSSSIKVKSAKLLSRRDLDDIGDRAWNVIFLDLIYDCHYGLKGGMSLEEFYYFHLVIRDLETPASINFLFKAMSHETDGRVDPITLMNLLRGNKSNPKSGSYMEEAPSSKDPSGLDLTCLVGEIFGALDKSGKGYFTLSDAINRPKLSSQLFELLLFLQVRDGNDILTVMNIAN